MELNCYVSRISWIKFPALALTPPSLSFFIFSNKNDTQTCLLSKIEFFTHMVAQLVAYVLICLYEESFSFIFLCGLRENIR
jgi:hypothetical protein